MKTEDPEIARLAAQAQKGRRALLDEAEVWRPEGYDEAEEEVAGAAPDGDGPPSDPDRHRFDHVRIPRFFGHNIRMVPIGMPEKAPITCLGKNGNVFYYLSPLGELVALEASEHGQAHIEGLWSPNVDDLHRAFPQLNQHNEFKGFAAQYARSAMMKACGLKRIFDPHDKVRGLGCWKGDDGELIQHLGDEIRILHLDGRTERFEPGEIGNHVYPGRPPLLPPKTGGREAAERVLGFFQKWNFARGELDARLLLGQQGAMILGAAIDWRPMAFLTGDAGTGKSTLQRLNRGLFPKRLISTVDATEAALRALLGQDALAVSFDEIEADASNDKAQHVMKLARTSASGDDAHRSGSDQVARSFTLRGSFLFSAIVPPPMLQQDMQRFAFLRLQTLPKGQVLTLPNGPELRDLGSQIVGRITENWPRWERTLSAFVLELQKRKHEHRGATQFGTMLAAAHILLEDREPDEEDFAKWCDPLQRDGLFEYENSEPAWLQAWRHLINATSELWRADGFPTVGDLIRKYLAAAPLADGKEDQKKIVEKLRRAGLSLVKQRTTGRIFLAIAPKHQALEAIFRGTNFQKGAWNIPLRNAPKVDGPMDPPRGVLHVDKCPALGSDKVAMFWIGGHYEAAGQWRPIFEVSLEDDEIDASFDDRAAEFITQLGRANSLDVLRNLWDRARPLIDAMEAAQADSSLPLEAAFNARWIELEEGKKA